MNLKECFKRYQLFESTGRGMQNGNQFEKEAENVLFDELDRELYRLVTEYITTDISITDIKNFHETWGDEDIEKWIYVLESMPNHVLAFLDDPIDLLNYRVVDEDEMQFTGLGIDFENWNNNDVYKIMTFDEAEDWIDNNGVSAASGFWSDSDGELYNACTDGIKYPYHSWHREHLYDLFPFKMSLDDAVQEWRDIHDGDEDYIIEWLKKHYEYDRSDLSAEDEDYIIEQKYKNEGKKIPNLTDDETTDIIEDWVEENGSDGIVDLWKIRKELPNIWDIDLDSSDEQEIYDDIESLYYDGEYLGQEADWDKYLELMRDEGIPKCIADLLGYTLNSEIEWEDTKYIILEQ